MHLKNPKYMKQKLTNIKEEIDKPAIIAEVLNSPHSIMDKTALAGVAQ